jgi:tRNA-specific 2-thiouridylase
MFSCAEDYRLFLHGTQDQVNPGPILDTESQVIGEHQGLAFYTIGQRKGLGIASSQPIYVISKDLERNALIVGSQEQLGLSELHAENVNWISGSPPEAPFRAQVKIRYKANYVWGMVYPLENNSVKIVFEQKLRDITLVRQRSFTMDRPV